VYIKINIFCRLVIDLGVQFVRIDKGVVVFSAIGLKLSNFMI